MSLLLLALAGRLFIKVLKRWVCSIRRHEVPAANACGAVIVSSGFHMLLTIFLRKDTPGGVYLKCFVDRLRAIVILFICLRTRQAGFGWSSSEFDNWGCGTAATAADCKSAPSGFIGSSPIIPTSQACIAQSVEHFVGNEEVTSSSLVAGSSRRCSSVGQSARFIPVLSLVRIQSPLPGN